jgi:hypothetical protein
MQNDPLRFISRRFLHRSSSHKRDTKYKKKSGEEKYFVVFHSSSDKRCPILRESRREVHSDSAKHEKFEEK